VISLPKFEKAFEYENNFYLSCDNSRIGKLIVHYELFKKASLVSGAIVECGIFKGASLIRFATFRNILSENSKKKIIGFDIFGKFPNARYSDDIKLRTKFINEGGINSISKDQLLKILRHKGLANKIELIKGDILKTVPKYVKSNPKLKISLLNLDTDLYEPAVTILESLYPKIVKGGILILDDYGVFPGETKAVDEYFAKQKIKINRFPYSQKPYFIIKSNN